MKIIACDVDGVLADIHTVWYARYNKDYNDTLKPRDVTEWEVDKFVKPECGLKIYDYLKDPTLYNEVLPYPGALDFINKLKKLGRVVYATSSPIESYGRKFLWLKEHGFIKSQSDYFEARDKSLVRAYILIDDYQENLRHFIGIKILFGQPWNSSEKNNPNYLFAKDYESVLEFC
jgi:5'-nucleotidase